VGSHRVVIQKYLSEGGFAHVYLVKLPAPVDGTDLAVLKRVAVPDKESLRSMRTEVETMKRLKGHRPIVAYMDSHASELRGGGYEVFLLMEFCDGGGLIDFMNTRLQHRLTEPEILNIFADVAEGVACMHYLKPALLHRDIKVENVLITTRSGGRRFMLCDFGSAAPPRPAPSSVVECRLMDEDVQKYTTLQYRSPEMVDVYRKQPLNEKADIWALGVFLYKLCYYTTPFEDQGQLAILNASYKFPSHPNFSDKLKRLIASMLREDLNARPNIYQVVSEACALQRRKVPIPDIYSGRSGSASSSKTTRESPHKTPKPVVGVSVSAPVQQKEKLPDITPMRRGRPTPSPTPSQQTASSGNPKRVTDGDPFAALDGKPAASIKTSAPDDDISERFPSLNQFSLLHHKGGNFDFEPKSPETSKPTVAPKKDMADKLADSAFAASRQAAPNPIQLERPHSATPVVSKAFAPPSSNTSASIKSRTSQPVSARPVSIQPLPASVTASRYVSTGTMTSDSSPEQRQIPVATQAQSTLQKPIARSASVAVRPTPPATSVQAARSQARPATPETPRFENVRGYSEFKASRPRPVSTNFDSRQQTLPDRSKASAQRLQSPSRDQFVHPQREAVIHGDSKRSSSYLEADNIGTRADDKPRDGAFGNAFSKFEQSSNDVEEKKQLSQTRPPNNPIPLDSKDDPGSGNESDEELTPEMRRERERLQLEEEEQRVAAAQSEYRQRLVGAAQGKKPAPGPKPGIIQNRMQAYMGEEKTQNSVARTAEGYGKYADAATAASKPKPQIKRKPMLAGVARSSTMPQTDVAAPKADITPTASAPSLTGLNKPTPRPPPKKPEYLNSISTGASAGGRSLSPVKNRSRNQPEQLVAEDVPGQPALEWSAQEKEDYLDDFSKRFPSLSAIEGGGGSR
ncbi:hypothetical protein LLEC1_02795, partial [Akanthomyces lecanii]